MTYMDSNRKRVGICEWVLPLVGVEAIECAARIGFDCIQIAERGGSEAGYPLSDQRIQDEYRRAIDHTGLQIHSLHLWTLCRQACMIHPLDSACGRVGLESICEAVKACYALEIPRLMLTSGFMCQIKNERDFVQFSESLRAACEIAGEKDITVVFESALDVWEIKRMCDIVGPSLRICYDIFNPIRFHTADPREEIKQIGLNKIDHFHLKDGPDNCIGCTLLGQGCGHFDEVMNIIQTLGYQGSYITENYYTASPLSEQDNFDALAHMDLKTIHRALQQQVL